jgi:thiol:disulfide interchange protein DsbD
VLETPEIAEAFERHNVLPLKADWTNRNPEVAHYLAEFGRGGIPFYLIYKPGGGTLLLGELLTKDAVLTALEQAATH